MSQETVEEQRPEDEVETEARREPQESVKDQEPAPEPELQQEAQGKRAGLLKDFKRVVDSVEGVGVSVISSSHLDTIGGGLKDTIRTVLTSRNSVVMSR